MKGTRSCSCLLVQQVGPIVVGHFESGDAYLGLKDAVSPEWRFHFQCAIFIDTSFGEKYLITQIFEKVQLLSNIRQLILITRF